MTIGQISSIYRQRIAKRMRSCSAFLPFWILQILLITQFCGSETLCSLEDTKSCSCVTISQGPTSSNAVYGNAISLTCRVENVVGQEVQWTKGGFGLGNDPSVPANSRYSMSDNSANSLSGNYDLTIENVQLEDEDVYQCQVTDCNIESASAYLTVLVPPYGPVINDADEEGNFRAVVNELIKITCEAWNAKPVADVSWFKGNKQITEGVEAEIYESSASLQNSSATLTLTPQLIDDQDVYTCIMNNDALMAANPGEISAQKKDVTLTVLAPPSFPIIIGYDPAVGTITVQEYDVVTIECLSLNGKPAPVIEWYRDNIVVTGKVDEKITEPDEYGRQNVSAYLRLIGNISDDNVRYSCTVMNDALSNPYSLSFILKVSTPLGAGAITAIVIVVAAFLVLLILLLILCWKRKQKRQLAKCLEPNQVKTQNTLTEEESSSTSQQTTVNTKKFVDKTSSISATDVTSKSISVDTTNSIAAMGMMTSFENSQGFRNGTYSESNSTTASSVHISTIPSSLSADGSALFVETGPPDGDIFSLSSSLRRSDRGSPVGQVEEYFDILSIQTSFDSWSTTFRNELYEYSTSKKNIIMGTEV